MVDAAQALKFAMDIARGMQYLHSLDPFVPRLYIKSSHIMVRRYFLVLLFQTRCHLTVVVLFLMFHVRMLGKMKYNKRLALFFIGNFLELELGLEQHKAGICNTCYECHL